MSKQRNRLICNFFLVFGLVAGVILALNFAIIYGPSSKLSKGKVLMNEDETRFPLGNNTTSSENYIIDDKIGLVLDGWADSYGLMDSLPVDHGIPSELPPWLPRAPHLENCNSIIRDRRESEQVVDNARYPEWAINDGVFRLNPPWVEGGDDQNLHFTRIAQRDLWVHQHPLDCQSPDIKFVVVNWIPFAPPDFGAQMHFMAQCLAVSISINRVLVPYPGSLDIARSNYCNGTDYGSLSCYFMPMVSEECETEALRLLRASNFEKIENPSDIINSPSRLIVVNSRFRELFDMLYTSELSKVWPKYKVINQGEEARRMSSIFEPWLYSEYVMRIKDRDLEVTPFMQYHLWFTSQALRYMLRWPSLRLCHLKNIVWHTNFSPGYAYEQMWALRRATEALNSKDLEELKTPGWENRLNREFPVTKPFLNRPILSIHVHKFRKFFPSASESLYPHMQFAEELHIEAPNIKHIWLSSDSEDVIREMQEHSSWIFYSTKMGSNWAPTNELVNAAEASPVGLRFVDLLISSQCDYFIGVLNSDWNRMVNELRMTNGHMLSTYISLTEWKF